MLFTRWLNGLSSRLFGSRRRISRRGSRGAKGSLLRTNSWIASQSGSDSSGLIRGVESLEDRALLANVASFAASGANLLLNTTGNAGTYTITKTGANSITVGISGGDTWTGTNSTPAGVTGATTSTLTINVTTFGAGNSITFNNGNGDAFALNFAGGATAFDNPFIVSLTGGAVDLAFITTTNTFISALSFTDTTNNSSVTQSQPVVFQSTSSFTLGTDPITLTNASNDFVGAVSATTTTNNAIQITDTNALPLGTVSTANTLTLIAGGSVTQTGTVTADTLVTTLTGGTSALSLNTQTNSITNLGAITAPGGVSLTNGNTSTTVTAAISTTNNAVAIDVGSGTYTQNNFDIVAGSGAITITADVVAITANTTNNALQTTGVLTLKPKSAVTTMSLADGGTFDLSQAEITDLAGGVTGAGSIVIGDSAASTAALTIGAFHLWKRLAPMPARGLAGWTLGLALSWSLLSTLWMPWLDYAKSYRSVFEAMPVPEETDCLSSLGLGESERAMLDYYAGQITIRHEIRPAEAALCDTFLMQGYAPTGTEHIDLRDWEQVWEGARPGDTWQRFWMFRRRSDAQGLYSLGLMQ